MAALCDRDRLLKQIVENGTNCLLFLSQLKTCTHLAQNLRFSNNHRIQSARYAEQVFNGPVVFIKLQVRRNVLFA